jgi:hypothetical protein
MKVQPAFEVKLVAHLHMIQEHINPPSVFKVLEDQSVCLEFVEHVSRAVTDFGKQSYDVPALLRISH